MDPTQLKAYMERRCMCGVTRALHAHSHDLDDNGKWAPDIETVRVIAVAGPIGKCRGFLDEIERELGGCPLNNKHLGPELEKTLRASGHLPDPS